jgi:hypothetical protein
MVVEDSDPADQPAGNQLRKGKNRDNEQIKKKPARQKKVSGPAIPKPEDLPPEVKCSYPEWQKFLDRYPMIHSLQREDFPDYGVSFVYVAHFYRKKNNAEESSLAHEEFEDFFKDIGYTYDYSGNFESRWFEAIGIKIN